jgi:hypothetical protein
VEAASGKRAGRIQRASASFALKNNRVHVHAMIEISNYEKKETHHQISISAFIYHFFLCNAFHFIIITTTIKKQKLLQTRS